MIGGVVHIDRLGLVGERRVLPPTPKRARLDTSDNDDARFLAHTTRFESSSSIAYPSSLASISNDLTLVDHKLFKRIDRVSRDCVNRTCSIDM